MESLTIYNNNKVIFLNDYLYSIYSNLKKDRNNPNLNNDSLIKKYIFDAESPEKKNKNLEQILNEINEEEKKIPEFNYLYLIALNQNQKLEIKKEDKDETESLNKEEKSEKTIKKTDEKINKNDNKSEENEKFKNEKNTFKNENIINKKY